MKIARVGNLMLGQQIAYYDQGCAIVQGCKGNVYMVQVYNHDLAKYETVQMPADDVLTHDLEQAAITLGAKRIKKGV